MSATAAPGPGQAGSISALLDQWRPLPPAAKGTVHSDSVQNRARNEPHRGSPKPEGNTLFPEDEKQATAPYPEDIIRAAFVLVGRISMPQTHLALMGDGEVWFPGHLHTPEPAVVSGFHRFLWLGRRSPLQNNYNLQDYVLPPSTNQPQPEQQFCQN